MTKRQAKIHALSEAAAVIQAHAEDVSDDAEFGDDTAKVVAEMRKLTDSLDHRRYRLKQAEENS